MIKLMMKFFCITFKIIMYVLMYYCMYSGKVWQGKFVEYSYKTFGEVGTQPESKN